MLKYYQIMFGLKVIFHKAKIARIRIKDHVLQCFAKVVHCCIIRVSFVYFGIFMRKIQGS